MERLLGPGGCPWDQAQTLDTLRPYVLEETYEVLEAMDDPQAHRKELGDLLFQIVFQSALRAKEGLFDMDDVIEGIRTKMLRRHPHVFGPRGNEGEPVMSPEQVAERWEAIKAAERQADAPQPQFPNPLRGLPKHLPALARSWRLQNKAAAVGFDWPDVGGALAKFAEEWEEFEQARESGDQEHMREEFGDLLFVLVRLGQKLELDAEDALRRANEKFERRFAHVMRRAHEEGIPAQNAGLAQLEAWWDEAKQLERATPSG